MCVCGVGAIWTGRLKAGQQQTRRKTGEQREFKDRIRQSLFKDFEKNKNYGWMDGAFKFIITRYRDKRTREKGVGRRSPIEDIKNLLCLGTAWCGIYIRKWMKATQPHTSCDVTFKCCSSSGFLTHAAPHFFYWWRRARYILCDVACNNNSYIALILYDAIEKREILFKKKKKENGRGSETAGYLRVVAMYISGRVQ